MAKLLAILLLLISIPTAVYLVTHPTIFKSRASVNGSITAIDSLGKVFPENKTKSRFIYFELEKPQWQLTYNQNPIIKEVFAQVIDTDVETPTLSHDVSGQAIPGQSFNVFFRNISRPTPKDWIGIFKTKNDNDHFENWIYTSSCTQSPELNKSLVSGSCSITIPSNATPDQYDVRLFADDGSNLITKSNKTFSLVPVGSAPESIGSIEIVPIPINASEPTPTPTPIPTIEITSRIRVSQDQLAVSTNGSCVDSPTVNPEHYCIELTANPDNPEELKRISWTLPDQSGDYTIYANYISNKGTSRITQTTIHYDKPSGSLVVPDFILGTAGQAIISQVLGSNKVPTGPVVGALIGFLDKVQESGEEIITVSQARQLGLDVNVAYDNDGTPYLDYDQFELLQMGISLDFQPGLGNDPRTNEPRIVVLPAPIPYYIEGASPITQEILTNTGQALEVGIENGIGVGIGEGSSKLVSWLRGNFKRFPDIKSSIACPIGLRNTRTDVLGCSVATPTIIKGVYEEKSAELAKRLNAEPLGSQTKNSLNFLDAKSRKYYTVFKSINRFDPQQRELVKKSYQAQIDFYKKHGGQVQGIPKYLGNITDDSGNVVGFMEEYIPSYAIKSYLSKNKKLTQEMVDEAVRYLEYVQKQTGVAHGNLIRDSIFNNSNKVELIEENVHLVLSKDNKWLIRFKGFESDNVDQVSGPLYKQYELDALKRALTRLVNT